MGMSKGCQVGKQPPAPAPGTLGLLVSCHCFRFVATVDTLLKYSFHLLENNTWIWKEKMKQSMLI